VFSTKSKAQVRRTVTIVVSLLLTMTLAGCGEDVPPSVRTQADLVRSGAVNRLAFSSPSDFDIYTESLIWLSDDSVVGDKATKYLVEVYKECSPGGRVVIDMGTPSPDGKSSVSTGTAQDPRLFYGLKLILREIRMTPGSGSRVIWDFIPR